MTVPHDQHGNLGGAKGVGICAQVGLCKLGRGLLCVCVPAHAREYASSSSGGLGAQLISHRACECALMRACVRVRVRACVRVCVCVHHASVFVRVRVRAWA